MTHFLISLSSSISFPHSSHFQYLLPCPSAKLTTWGWAGDCWWPPPVSCYQSVLLGSYRLHFWHKLWSPPTVTQALRFERWRDRLFPGLTSWFGRVSLSSSNSLHPSQPISHSRWYLSSLIGSWWVLLDFWLKTHRSISSGTLDPTLPPSLPALGDDGLSKWSWVDHLIVRKLIHSNVPSSLV